jgi:hypothetical protein
LKEGDTLSTTYTLTGTRTTAKGLKLVALEHQNKKRVSLEQKNKQSYSDMDHSSGDFGTLKTNGWCLSQKMGTHPQTFYRSGTVRQFVYSGIGTINGSGLILRLAHDALESNERAY